MSKIKNEYVPAKQLAKIIRGPLRTRYGTENVSVHCGSGTASGWIHADVEVEKPADCFCKPHDTYCERCRNRMHETAEEARKIVRIAMEKAEAKFGTYTADDGYNSEHEEFLLQVNIKRS